LDFKQTLLNIGGSNIDAEDAWGNFKDSRVVRFLLERGREFSTAGLQCLQETPFPDHHYSFRQDACHKNCIELCCYVRNGESQYAIVYGWALSNDGIWYTHSWCIKRTQPERIVETTRARVAYFGFVVPQSVNALSMWIVPSTLGDQLEKWKSISSQSSSE
jgi:hypothetical protein